MSEHTPNFVDTLIGQFWVPKERNTQEGPKIVLNCTMLTEDGDKRIVSFWPGDMRDSKEPMLGNGLSVLITALAKRELWNELPKAMQASDTERINAIHTQMLAITTKTATPFRRNDMEGAKAEAAYLNERLAGKIVRIDFEHDGTYTDNKTGEVRNRWKIPAQNRQQCPIAPSPRENDDTFAGEKVADLLAKLATSGSGLSEEEHVMQNKLILEQIYGTGAASAPQGGSKPATSPGGAPF